MSSPVIRSAARRLALARPSWLCALLAIALSLISSPPLKAEANAGAPSKEVVRATLENGLRVIVVRDPLSPVVTTVVNYLAGSDDAPPGFPGTAHAEEHMMFRGSAQLSADQLAYVAAAMGGRFNADTQQTVTQYFFTVPAKDMDLALQIEAIRMSGVLDTQALWQKERGAIEQEVAQDLSNPQYVFYTKLLQRMFAGTPYEHDALGTVPSFNKTTAAMLAQFHRNWYVPNNAVLIVAGDVDSAAVLREVRQLFGPIPARRVPPHPAVHLSPVQGESLNLKTDLPYGLAVVSFRLPGSDSPDYAAAQVLADVLASQRGSLYALVPQGKALAAGFSASSLPTAGLGYAYAAFPQGGNGSALLAEIRAILAADVKNGLPAELVEAEKRHEVTDAEFTKNSVEGLAMEWSEAVAIEGRHSPDDDIQAISRVTLADVNRVARQYLDPDHAIVAMLTPQASGKPVSTKTFGGRESLTPTSTKPVILPVWAKSALERVSLPTSTVHPVVSTLPNGIRLIVQPESVSNTVSVYGGIRIKPDVETPAGEDGVNGVLDELFSYGTTSLGRLAFQKALDDIGANESAGSNFSVQVLPQFFERGVELLADNELHPALPADAFTIIQPQLASAVAGELQSPGFLKTQALHAGLYPPHDPTLRHATPATVSALTIQQVRNYYERTFRPDLTTIVVIGKIEPRQAATVIGKYFGEWKADGPKPPTELPAVPPNKPVSTAVPDPSRVQDNVTLAETVAMNRFNPDYYAVRLGDAVLGGGFYATRLYRDLRENGGLVYFVSASLEADRTRAVYEVNYGCDPANVSKARVIVVHDLQEMQSAPVSDSELRQAKAMLLREIPLSESSVSSIAEGLIARSIVGLPLDEPMQAARRYMELDAQQVQAAFARWLRPESLVQVTEGPPPK